MCNQFSCKSMQYYRDMCSQISTGKIIFSIDKNLCFFLTYIISGYYCF